MTSLLILYNELFSINLYIGDAINMNSLRGCLFGYISSCAFILCFIYSLYKRQSNFKKLIGKKISSKNMLNFHCLFGITAVSFSIIHVLMEHGGLSSVFGFICLISMITAGISGFLMRHFNKIYNIIFKKVFTKVSQISTEILSKIRIALRYIHIGTSLLFIISLIFHLLLIYLM